MNNTNIFLIIALAVVSTALVLVSVTSLNSNDTGDCYADAIELAETSVNTTDEFADYTIDTLEGILRGQPHNEAEMRRIANDHHANTATLADIQSRCDAS